MKKQDLPSYLQVLDKKSQNTLSFKRHSVITLMQMVQEQLHDLSNPKLIAHHRKQLEIPHFVIQVTDNYKKWIIIKRLTELIQLEKNLKAKYNKIPSIPIRKQHEIMEKNQNQILQLFQVFLNVSCSIPQITLEKDFLKFIQNFVPLQRKKMKVFKQITLRKRAGGRHNQSAWKKAMSYFTNWDKKFFTITSQGVYFTNNDSDFRIQQMIPFFVGFKLLYGQNQTGYTYGIVLNSAHRMLNIDAENIQNMVYFVYFIKKAMKQNNYLSVKRYHSFADVRLNCNAKYYIDGKNYFSDVFQALREAKTEVFITGWMISPYFHLRRPDPMNQTRIDKVLQKIANCGIKISIIVYMQPKVALNIDSQFTQHYLMSLSPNIKVLRHPPYILIPFLWSHHEKMVVIDQKIAFVGGLDIGYGRYDDNQHRLHDINQEIWMGIDYCNYRKTDILKPRQYKNSSIDRTKQPRMPWHDVAVRVTGASVLDLSRHFVQFWNYVNFQLNMDERQLLVFTGLQEQDIQKKQRYEQHKKNKGVAQYRRRSRQFDIQEQLKKSLNTSNPSIIDQQQLIQDHEQEMMFYAQNLKSDISNTGKISKLFHKLKQKSLSATRNAVNVQQLVVTQVKQDQTIQKGNQKHQFLRSASMWSLGLGYGQDERSILEAYVQLIYNSKEFIYIENQFFISVQNTVSKALVQRISRAYQHKQKFRLVVVIPSLPGFDGQIHNQSAAVMRVQVHHIYNTICRGKKSIFQQLKFIPNLNDYLQFFTLRTHALMGETPISEIVYVHSKIMIVDDQIALIGSANINDRSLLGSRDSQIAIVIQDEQSLDIKIGQNKSRKVKKFAHNLRVQLFMQHFAKTRQQVQDYLNQNTWWSMIQHADKNQEIYRQVFGIYPDNSMRTFKDILKVHESKDPTKYQLLKQLIKGNAILFQGSFLDEQNLDLKPGQKQYIVPPTNFT